MSSVAKAMREEMIRVSRTQLRSAAAKLRKSDSVIRRVQADLKHRLAKLETAVKLLARKAEARGSGGAAASDEEPESPVVTGKMVRSMRNRLGVSQENLAKLLNITAQSVYLWERKGGKLRLRANTAMVLAAVRKMSKKDAQAKLAHMASAKKRRLRR